jgi:hypothetical protein
VRSSCCHSPPFNLLNQLTDFRETGVTQRVMLSLLLLIQLRNQVTISKLLSQILRQFVGLLVTYMHVHRTQ